MKNLRQLILIVFILASCQKSTASDPSIFENPVCQPPCWENIAPGVTTKKDALAILSRIAMVDQPVTDLNRSTIVGFDGEIRFSFYKDESFDGYIYLLDDRVSMLGFGNGFAKQPNITLQDAIQSFGVPQNILVVHSGHFDRVMLINSQTGIAFGYTLTGSLSLDSSALKPETEISSVMFFDPSQYERVLNSGILSSYLLNGSATQVNLRTWNGYGSFKAKYWPPATPPSQ